MRETSQPLLQYIQYFEPEPATVTAQKERRSSHVVVPGKGVVVSETRGARRI